MKIMFERSWKFLAAALALSLPMMAVSQVFTLGDAEVPVGATEATLVWQYDAEGGPVTGIGVFFDYDTARLTPVLDPPAGDPPVQVVSGCLGAATDPLPIKFCEPTLTPPPQLSLGLSNLFSPMPSLQPGGSITFTINPPLADGEVLPVQAIRNDAGVTPGGSTLVVNSGEIRAISAPPAQPAIDPASWTVTVGVGATNPSEIFTIRNNAAAGQTPPAQALDITTIGISGAGAAAFSTAGTCVAGTSSLGAQESCTVIVTLDASTVGNFAGSLDVGTSAGGLNATLNGTVNPSDANLTIAPAAHDFGSLDINAPAGSQAFTVTNTATNDAVTGISVPALAAPFAITANTCGASLAPGVNCSITVSFNPTAAGNFTGTLAVNSAANNVSAALEGVGTATPNLSVNPPFGPVNLGSASAGETITVSQFAGAPTGVTNAGSADGTVACTLQNESTAGVFSTNPALTNVPVPAGETVLFSVSCALPADGEDGDAYTATLACSVDGAPAVDATSHFLSCSVSEFDPIPVPTMSAWSLALFALLMLLVGGISIRFFRV